MKLENMSDKLENKNVRDKRMRLHHTGEERLQYINLRGHEHSVCNSKIGKARKRQ